MPLRVVVMLCRRADRVHGVHCDCTHIPVEPMGRDLDSRRAAVNDGATEGLWREGDHWALRYRGREARLKDAKGLGYLALLLEHPGAEIHVLEIVDRRRPCAPPHATRPSPMADDATGAGPGLDAQAKAAYRARAEELREEIDQAGEWADPERAARAHEELDFIARELARAVGLGGRDRPTAPRQSARARTSGARCTRRCARSRRVAGARRPSRARGEHRRLLLVPPRAEPAVPFLLSGTDDATHGDVHADRRPGSTAPRPGAARALQRRDLIAAACRQPRHALQGSRRRAARPSPCSRAQPTPSRARSRSSTPWNARTGRGRPHWPSTPARPTRRRTGAGPPLNRCARIRALAHDGQVLVSGAVRELAGEDLPAGAGLRDLGPAPAARPRAPGAALPAHPSRPAARLPTAPLRRRSPPQPAAPAHQLRRARAGAGRARGAARRARLVTLTGAGGSGKTRLAIEVAAATRRTAPRRRLAGRSRARVRRAARPQGGRAACSACASGRTAICSTTSSSACASRSCCSCSTTASTWPTPAPGSPRICCAAARSCGCWRRAASRSASPASRCTAPARWPVPEAGRRLDAIARAERRSGRASQLDSETAPVVGHVCRRLDGLPLAIELAAARTASLSLDDLASRLDDRFALLTGGARTALPRQRTLEATVAWSYDLLGPTQRVLFDRLSVFAGGWTLDAAETVCAAPASSRHVADDLASWSTSRSSCARAARYRLLETLRQYGREPAARDRRGARRPRRPPRLDGRSRRGGRAASRRPRAGDVARPAGARARQPARGARVGDHLRRRRVGPATRLDHVGQPLDLALARPGGPALAAAPARDLGRGAHERARQGPAGRRAGRLPGRELAARGRSVRPEPRPLPGGGRARRRGAGADLDGLQPLGHPRTTTRSATSSPPRSTPHGGPSGRSRPASRSGSAGPGGRCATSTAPRSWWRRAGG